MINVSLKSVEISNGKRILLLAPVDFDEADCEAVAEGLKKKFPECEWAILTGGFQVITLESEDV